MIWSDDRHTCTENAYKGFSQSLNYTTTGSVDTVTICRPIVLQTTYGDRERTWGKGGAGNVCYLFTKLSLFSLYMQRFLRYAPIFKIAIFEHETWPLAKVPEVAHILPFYPMGSKLSPFSLYGQRFLRYGVIINIVLWEHMVRTFYFSSVCPVLLIGLPRFPKTVCILRPQLINIQRLPK